MADSVRASFQGLQIVNNARRLKGWNKTADIWCQSALTSRATLKRFWEGKQIQKETFIRICQAVGVTTWEEIIERVQVSKVEENADFVGRQEELAALHSMVNQGAKVILIQGEGGVGKTKLARKYFKTCGFELLELWMPMEAKDVVPVETVVEEWLRREFQEEPGRSLWTNLQRLNRKLRDENRRIGILIDNLESALDKNGNFIDYRRPYLELLKALADPAINSVTLITSRERLCEAGIDINFYLLKGLEESAWKTFLYSRNISCNSPYLGEMWKAYGGNAKAMQILSGSIIKDFDGDIESYWLENKNDLLIERELENLVVSQFKRLQEIDIEAYRLLCRLGCYRYQDMSYVSIEGILCLLWDVPELQRKRVVNRLCDRSLVEYTKGKYWLHPVILTEAISRLRESEDWQIANRKAADFWTHSVEIIKNTSDALKALEAYYHYVAIEDFEQAVDVIIKQRNNIWGNHESLGRSLYKCGLLEQSTTTINQILSHLKIPSYRSAKLYQTLAAVCWLSGDIHKAIRFCDIARSIANQSLQSTERDNHSDNTKLKLLIVNSLLTTGICQIGLWELEAAFDTFSLALEICKEIDYEKFAPSALFYLAFLYSCLQKNQEAIEIANYLYNRLPEHGYPSWITEYRLYYLALTYTQLGVTEKALKIYKKNFSYASSSFYTQAKNKALCGLAYLHRQQGEFTKSLLCYEKAIKVLNEIGAKCDLAEAYYQIGLTYKQMGNIALSNQNFEKAINLFEEIQAPKQVEKVKRELGIES